MGVPVLDLARSLATGGARLAADVQKPFRELSHAQQLEEFRRDNERMKAQLDLLVDYQKGQNALTQQQEQARIPQAQALSQIAGQRSELEASLADRREDNQTRNAQSLVTTVAGTQGDLEDKRSQSRINEGKAEAGNTLAITDNKFVNLGRLVDKVGGQNLAIQSPWIGNDSSNSVVDRVLARSAAEHRDFADLYKLTLAAGRPQGVERLARGLAPVLQFGALVAGIGG